MNEPRLLPLDEKRSFIDRRSSQTCALTAPDGPPSGRQLLALWNQGMLAIVYPDAEAQLFTRAQAAWAIWWLRGGDE